MKSNMEWITSLEKNYSVLMEENDQTRFSQLLLKAALIRNEPIDRWFGNTGIISRQHCSAEHLWKRMEG